MIACSCRACYGAPMDHRDFKAARLKLGLSVSQAALMLGCQDQHIRRMEMQPENTSARPVNGATKRLVKAYLAGYRPPDWPL